MKNLAFITLFAMPFIVKGQNGEKIAINNSLISWSFEAATVTSNIDSDGDSKYYTSRTDSYGFTIVMDKGSGYSIGSNIEFNVNKNARTASILTGMHYIQHGGPVFISQGDHPSTFFWDWDRRITDEVGNLRINSIKLPLALKFNILTFGKRKNAALSLEFGSQAYYNINAKVIPYEGSSLKSISVNQDASQAIQKFYYNVYLGSRVRYGRFFAVYNISVVDPTNLWKEEYGSDEETKEKVQTIGIGYYIKK